MQPFSHSITVQKEDIDAMGHVNNVVYVSWVQQVAEAHWNTRATEQQLKDTLWVVLRHEIDYLKPAFEADELYGRTWVEEPNGPKIVRNVEIVRVEDEQVLVKAKTTWCALNAGNLRPKRIDQPLMDIFL